MRSINRHMPVSDFRLICLSTKFDVGRLNYTFIFFMPIFE